MKENFLKRVWEKHKDNANFTFLEFQNLYNFLLKMCNELGIDYQTFDFEHEIDYSLTYNENKALLEQKLISCIYPNSEPKELEELEYYKKELEKLRNKKEIKVIEKLERKIGSWQEKFKEFEQKLNNKEDIDRLEQKINDFIGFLSHNIEINTSDNPIAKEIKDRENRIMTNILLQTKKERLSDECPRCFKKGNIVKGVAVEKIPFKQSLAFIFSCPLCGFKWGAQAFIGELGENKRKEEFENLH